MNTRGGYQSFTLAMAGFLLLGCGGAKPDGKFPTRDEIAALSAAPPPTKIKVGDDVDAASWQLAGPIPDAVSDAPQSGSTPWGQAILGAVARRPGTVIATQSMECAAREAASFALGHESRLPGRAIRRFIAGRCGAPSSYIGLGSAWLSHVAAEKSDAECFAALRAEADKMLGTMDAGLSYAGLGFARVGDKAAIVLATAQRRVRIEPLPVVQSGGSVVLRGELLDAMEHVRALVTSGSYGFQECALNLALDLPRFEISCPVAKGDASATVELVGFPAGRMLGDSLLDITVFQAAPTTGYTGSTSADSSAAPNKEALARALFERVNAVRKEAGMRLLRVSPAQSKTADTLAPYYFSAVTGGASPLLADKIALGMMAGWDVEGEVREGHFSSGAYPHLDPSRLLDDLAARPFGRETLFDPDASTLALGVLPTAEGALGAVLGTYSSFGGAGSTAEETNQILDRLTALRKAKKLPAPRLITELDQDARKAAARAQGGDDPKEALDGMLRDAVARLQTGSVQGWALSASTVKDLKLPSELLSLPNLPVALAVVHSKPPGSPWTQLLVFVVIVHLDGATTARAGAPLPG